MKFKFAPSGRFLVLLPRPLLLQNFTYPTTYTKCKGDTSRTAVAQVLFGESEHGVLKVASISRWVMKTLMDVQVIYSSQGVRKHH